MLGVVSRRGGREAEVGVPAVGLSASRTVARTEFAAPAGLPTADRGYCGGVAGDRLGEGHRVAAVFRLFVSVATARLIRWISEYSLLACLIV
jgi:hypothetical protein